MIYATEHDPHATDTHQVEVERDEGDIERLIDEAALKFARLFYDQCVHAKQQRTNTE